MRWSGFQQFDIATSDKNDGLWISEQATYKLVPSSVIGLTLLWAYQIHKANQIDSILQALSNQNL
jgi:hypothetical protein